MKKDDLEYQSGQEYAPLPDEYLQGGGNIVPPAEKRRPVWKKMIYMAAAFALMAYVAFQPAQSDTAQEPVTEVDAPQGTQEMVTVPEETQEPVPTQEDDGNETPTEGPESYPFGNGIVHYVVYNDSFDPATYENRILAEGDWQEAELAAGMEYTLPDYEPQEGFVFQGWVMQYKTKSLSGKKLSLLGGAVTAEDVRVEEPDEDGNRRVEIHAAWMSANQGELSRWPYLLTLDANGGSIENAEQMTKDAMMPMMSGGRAFLCAYSVPERDGYRFTGWYESPEGGKEKEWVNGLDFYEKSGDDYDWSSTIPVTLYAGWEKTE